MSCDHEKGDGRIARQIVTELQKTYGALRKMHHRRSLTKRESKNERKFITDTLRRGKKRHAKAKAAPGYDPNVLPPTSKLRKAAEARQKPGNTLFDRMLADPAAKEVWQRKQNEVNRARVAAGEVTEEFLAKWFARPKKPTRGARGRKATLERKTTTQRRIEREEQAFQLHKKGRLDREIAGELGVSVKTIERALNGRRIR